MQQLTGINLQNIQTAQYQKKSNIPKYQTSNNPIKKWMEDLNVRPGTIKLLLEENTGRTLYAINHSKIFFDPPPRVMEIKTKINKWDLMKFKSFEQQRKP